MSAVDPNPQDTGIPCGASLGMPRTANCESALFEFIGSGPVTLDTRSGSLNDISGNCAFGIGNTSKLATTREPIRSIANILLVICKQNLVNGVVGGHAIRHATVHNLQKRSAQPLPQAPEVTVSIDLQGPFDSPPSKTCAWKMASFRAGDVRRCPAPTAPWRPSEQRLGEKRTTFGE